MSDNMVIIKQQSDSTHDEVNTLPFVLKEIKHIDMFHFDLWEGKFEDISQSENGYQPTYIYACLSEFDGATLENCPVRIFAHSVGALYDSSAYALAAMEADRELCAFLRSEILQRVMSAVTKEEKVDVGCGMAAVTGYAKARSLMRDDGWRMRVVMHGQDLIRTEIFHPAGANTVTVRKDSAKKLIAECMVCGRENDATAILRYGR